MRSIVPLAVVSAVLLALFLLLRPVIGGIGNPTAPDVSGRAQPFVADGAIGAPPVNFPAPSPTTTLMRTKPSANDAARLGISRLDQVEQLVFELTNAERRKARLRDLTREDKLRQIAEEHSDDMLARGFFEHVNPDGQSPADRVALGHRQLIGGSGENIWLGTGMDLSDPGKLAGEIVRDWMNSSGHRENILRDGYTHLGVGISVIGKEVRATQLFAAARAYL
ncbi:MAG: CAP domain-containing protein, partial [Blastocatellia bacterium]